MTDKPKALQLLTQMNNEHQEDWDWYAIRAELRRLHEVNQALVGVLKVCINNPYREGTASYNKVIQMAQAALAKAKEST